MSESAGRLVSVVVPFFNRREDVDACLGSLLHQRLPEGLEAEIIAVDNGSTDGTREALDGYAVKVVDCASRGPGAARNAGIGAARGEIIVMTDSDCVAHGDWLARLIEPFSDPEVLAAGGRIRARSLELGVECFAESFGILDQRKFFRGTLCFPPFVATANAAYRRGALEQVGGFDETLWMSEDADLCWRVLELGGKLALCPGAVIRHAHRRTFAGLFAWGVSNGRAGVMVFAKHRKRMGRRFFVDWGLIARMASLAVLIPWNLLVSRDGFGRKRAIYEAVWFTGLVTGRLGGCWRERVLFV